MFDLRLSIDEAPLAFLDVETTGLEPRFGDRVCEVAILRCQGEDVLDALQHLVDPQRPMGPGAYAVHHISDEMLRGAPTFGEVADDVLELLEGAVLVGHNTPFDLGFVTEELARLGRELPPLVALDTLRLARRHYRLSSYSLTQLAAALGVDIRGHAHRAMNDVLLTRAVLQRLVGDLWGRGVRTVDDYIQAQGGAVFTTRAPPPDIPEVLQEALRERSLLRLRYLSERGEETDRLVRPITISDRGGYVSLVAHCYLRDALRAFRLDRILEMDLVSEAE
jgi:DNA polymerase III epsilon subunit family exonuclease